MCIYLFCIHLLEAGRGAPNATDQQSWVAPPSSGSIAATGRSFCLGSQTLTEPEFHSSAMMIGKSGSHHPCYRSQVRVHLPRYSILRTCEPTTIQCLVLSTAASGDSYPSMALTMTSCALTEYTGISVRSKSLHDTTELRLSGISRHATRWRVVHRSHQSLSAFQQDLTRQMYHT